MNRHKDSEAGAASILIRLSNGQISVTHGTEDITLARTERTKAGDWQRLIDFLKQDLGLIWQVPE